MEAITDPSSPVCFQGGGGFFSFAVAGSSSREGEAFSAPSSPVLAPEVGGMDVWDELSVSPITLSVTSATEESHSTVTAGMSRLVIGLSRPGFFGLWACRGWVCGPVGHEYKFMKEIARDVCEKLYPTEEIGIHRRQEEIENLLCKQPWGVRTLGIFGKPGIGKTTLAIALFRHMSGGYDASCLIKDFDTKYNEKRLTALDTDYLSETPMEKFDLNCIDSKPILRKKRVLIALDDVQNAPDAKSFLGGFDKFGPGSLIIITSQNKQVLEECQMSEFYNLKGLNDDETLELFTRCAFGNIVIEENLMDLSKKEIQSSKKMVEMVSTLPDVCEVLIAENNYIRLIPYEEYNEAQENKEFQSDNDGVLATRDTDLITLTTSDLCSKSYPQKSLRARLYNRFSKSIPRNLRLYRLDYNSMIRSLSEHFQKHHVLVQGVSSQLQKLSQSFSNSRDHDLLEQNLQRLLTLSGGCDRIKRVLDFLRKIRELNRKGEEN
ncbi:unnamed protein product [Brassica oleracea var. botrytis]|uniref:(rape) hypothetical protein n=1 Tax=Brassica napus TaxID=3708 RepID=A0A816MCV8_BRANA|nr:unnamed protein product [Brassica napus]